MKKDVEPFNSWYLNNLSQFGVNTEKWTEAGATVNGIPVTLRPSADDVSRVQSVLEHSGLNRLDGAIFRHFPVITDPFLPHNRIATDEFCNFKG